MENEQVTGTQQRTDWQNTYDRLEKQLEQMKTEQRKCLSFMQDMQFFPFKLKDAVMASYNEKIESVKTRLVNLQDNIAK